MNELKGLIMNLCPNGVPFVRIGDVFTRLRGTPITAAKMKEIEANDGDVTIFAGGKTVVKAREKDIVNGNVIKMPAVLVQSRGVVDFIFCDTPFTFKNEMWAYTSKERVSVKYLFYLLKNDVDHFRLAASGMGSLPQISLPVTEDYKIPVPPLEVQREIVRILDNFTELAAEHMAVLTGELAARRKQFLHYREKLLDGAKESSPRITIAELGKWSGGKTPSMDRRDYWEGGTVPWISSKDMKNGTLLGTEDHITRAAVDGASMHMFPKNCTAVVTRSGILKHTFPVAYIPFETTVNQDIKILVPCDKVLPRFAYHILNAYSERIRTATKKRGGTVDSLDFSAVLKYEIPLPDKTVQERIVSILDNYETTFGDLCADLSCEIEIRKKQYEYYRDRLLTFQEAK